MAACGPIQALNNLEYDVLSVLSLRPEEPDSASMCLAYHLTLDWTRRAAQLGSVAQEPSEPVPVDIADWLESCIARLE